MAKKKPARRSWIVRIRCTVIKEIVTDDCTEDEAHADPFAHSVEENHLEHEDWDVLSVKPNE